MVFCTASVRFLFTWSELISTLHSFVYRLPFTPSKPIRSRIQTNTIEYVIIKLNVVEENYVQKSLTAAFHASAHVTLDHQSAWCACSWCCDPYTIIWWRKRYRRTMLQFPTIIVVITWSNNYNKCHLATNISVPFHLECIQTQKKRKIHVQRLAICKSSTWNETAWYIMYKEKVECCCFGFVRNEKRNRQNDLNFKCVEFCVSECQQIFDDMNRLLSVFGRICFFKIEIVFLFFIVLKKRKDWWGLRVFHWVFFLVISMQHLIITHSQNCFDVVSHQVPRFVEVFCLIHESFHAIAIRAERLRLKTNSKHFETISEYGSTSRMIDQTTMSIHRCILVEK